MILNPFTISRWSDEEIGSEFTKQSELVTMEETPYHIAHDIDTYANMGYLIGEMVARYSELANIKELEVESMIANDTYREREQWLKEKAEKPPAMEYFKSKAISKCLDELKALEPIKANVKRYKLAFDSLQDKQNALKKKLESVKIEYNR